MRKKCKNVLSISKILPIRDFECTWRQITYQKYLSWIASFSFLLQKLQSKFRVDFVSGNFAMKPSTDHENSSYIRVQKVGSRITSLRGEFYKDPNRDVLCENTKGCHIFPPWVRESQPNFSHGFSYLFKVEVHSSKTLETENSNFRSLLKFSGFP
jgi:hypothetical protein